MIGGSTGRRLVGDVIDIGALRDIGAPSNIWLVVQLQTAMTSGGSATVQIELASDAQAAIATDASATVHATSASFAFDSRRSAIRCSSACFRRKWRTLPMSATSVSSSTSVRLH